MDLLDMWSLSYPLLIVAFFEIIVVSWVYGVERYITFNIERSYIL